MLADDCVFCRIADGRIPSAKVYEDAKASIEAGNIAGAITLLNEPTIYTKELYELADFCNTVNPYIGEFKLEGGTAPLKSSENTPPSKMTTTLSNIRIGDNSVIPQLHLNGLMLLYQYDNGNFAYAGRYKQGDYVFTHSGEDYILELKTKQGEKKESVFTRASDYAVIDLNSKKVMKEKEESVDTNEGKGDNEDVTFTNKYGTHTTRCAHSGCNEYIAPSGDTNCCIKHSNKCADCGKYIDEDAMYCMDCLQKEASSNSSGSSSDPTYQKGSEWEKYDKDGSGTISQEEYQNADGDYIEQNQ